MRRILCGVAAAALTLVVASAAEAKGPGGRGGRGGRGDDRGRG